MKSAARTFVIVGAGLAGAKAAQALRENGCDGRVVLLGAERERPYERPPLSKDYLRGDSCRERVHVHAAGFYEDHDIELRTDTAVESLDPSSHEVLVAGGERLRYDRLLLATGARPRRLDLLGAQLDCVLVLRTLDECDVLRDRLRTARRIVVVGAGWIGCEVAACARQMGVEVDVVEPLSVPLERVLGTQVGAVFADIHAGRGVRMHLGCGVVGFEGTSRVRAVHISDGERLACDLVLVDVGASPRTEIAQRAGIEVTGGIVVDERLRTSAPDVFAAGDVASAYHPLLRCHIRVEHWANALDQGPAAARSMLGEEVAYDRIPYVFSDQYDVGMEYCGHASQRDEVVLRGDAQAREFIAFWLRDGRVRAAMNVNVWDVTDAIQALIRSPAPVDRERLADPDLPLEHLLPAPTWEP
jgi:3-phenylpropionate/trans-cinnamate dioxygenase ferredoxin reductase subunit